MQRAIFLAVISACAIGAVGLALPQAAIRAFPFCFLSAADISAQEGVSVNVYGNNDAVFIHHSNADGTWFRLSRFGGYKNVYYISTNYYPTNRDWQAWNLYTSETNLNIKEELQ